MIPAQATKFPVLVTAARQEHLDHPAWPMVLANWKARFQRVRCLIPASARVDDKVMIYVRQKDEAIALRDVVEWANKSIDALHTSAIIADPLVIFHAALLQIIAPEFQLKRRLGTAWVASGSAVRIDEKGAGEALEDDCMRWFAGGSNAWNVFGKYVNSAVSFTAPLWSGYLAGMAQRKLHESQYFDCTAMKAVGTAMPPVGDYDPTGFEFFALNTPARAYRDLEEAV